MNDFNVHTGIGRDTMVEALTDNPEQLAYVLGGITGVLTPQDVAEAAHQIDEDHAAVASFYRELANLIEPLRSE